jgi:hypothetical protein
VKGRLARGGDLTFAALAGVLLLINAAGATAGMPVMDDGELLSTSREAGIAAIGPTNRDRPINGWLIQESLRVFGERPALWAATAALLWGLLAWQTARLVRRLFPGDPLRAGLAALLVIAPLVVQMQYTTLTFIYVGCLPLCLCLEGLLAVLDTSGARERVGGRLAAAGVLVAAGAIVTEYAVAAMAAGVALLLVLRRWRGAAALGIGGVIGHAAFKAFADAAARPETAPAAQLARLPERLGTQLGLWMSGVWQSLIGAYGTAVGAVKIDASSKSTFAAVVLGLLCAGAVALASRDDGTPASPDARRPLAGLLVAVCAGLLPVVLAGRDPSSDWFLSRFRLPILPFAVAATIHIVDRLTAGRGRLIARAAIGFLAGYTVLAGASEVKRRQQVYDQIGALVLPIARASEGLTAVVIADPNYSTVWSKMMRRWSLEDERRAWALDAGSARKFFGPRVACRDTSQLHAPPTLRNVGRDGPLARLLWVENKDNLLFLEPYCAAPSP